ncbi:hypothetical protein GQ607_015878 [Colletotrichum asianum]|uniref:Uncharacterized protein n=1 Tax=Colletotrichum asianum TaxID=702518 RepID=A0A8H3VWW9_9PEZI|nr:hypothetical protein GQ607_015878 [Colletotrichum asianum]
MPCGSAPHCVSRPVSPDSPAGGGSEYAGAFPSISTFYESTEPISLSLPASDQKRQKRRRRKTSSRRYCSPRASSTCLYYSTTPISPFRPSGFGREFHGAYCHRPGPPKPEHVRDTRGFERSSSAVRAGKREREERGAREGKGGERRREGRGAKPLGATVGEGGKTKEESRK